MRAGTGTREFTKMADLLKGQRATALLLLLLGASTNAPLVIDQPEDDLDKRFVYDGIVTNLRSLKGKRQIIASTHNANVPVLGDAELIVAPEGDGQNRGQLETGLDVWTTWLFVHMSRIFSKEYQQSSTRVNISMVSRDPRQLVNPSRYQTRRVTHRG